MTHSGCPACRLRFARSVHVTCLECGGPLVTFESAADAMGLRLFVQDGGGSFTALEAAIAALRDNGPPSHA